MSVDSDGLLLLNGGTLEADAQHSSSFDRVLRHPSFVDSHSLFHAFL